MKKFTALLTVFILLLTASALAFEGADYPAWDGATTPDNGFGGAFGDDRIALTFDPSDEYSFAEDGVVQACFFAYDADESNYLELYLMLPQDVQSGDVLHSGEGLDCALYLFEIGVTSGNDTEYFAGDPDSVSDGSSFEMRIESVQTSGTTISISGTLTAQMTRYENNLPQRDSLTIGDAHFSFSLSLTGGAYENPFAPAPTQHPDDHSDLPSTPAPELPPKYVSI